MPVQERSRPQPSIPSGPKWEPGKLGELLKKLGPERLDSGDVLLILILLLLWKEGEDKDLLLALAGAFLLGSAGDT